MALQPQWKFTGCIFHFTSSFCHCDSSGPSFGKSCILINSSFIIHLDPACSLGGPWWAPPSPSPPGASELSFEESAFPRLLPWGQCHRLAESTKTIRQVDFLPQDVRDRLTATRFVSDLVVDVAVCKHCVEVVNALLGVPVEAVFQTLFDCAHVHRGFDDLIIVLGKDRAITYAHQTTVLLTIQHVPVFFSDYWAHLYIRGTHTKLHPQAAPQYKPQKPLII